jgi:hypothetical protein
MVVLTCPDCGAHDDAIVCQNREVIFSCPYCHYVGRYGAIPKENFGKMLLVFSANGVDFVNYALMTVRLQDSALDYFVLSNTEVVHEGKSMSDAAEAYYKIITEF